MMPLLRMLLQCRPDDIHGESDVLPVDAHGRLDPEHVALETAFPEKEAKIAATFPE